LEPDGPSSFRISGSSGRISRPGQVLQQRERLGRLDHAAQRLVDAVAQLPRQARVEGQQLDVHQLKGQLVAEEVL
jgi:hypothetical protein